MPFQYRILYSQPHDFLYHPEFHPDKVGQVAMTGWRCVAECEFEGLVGKAEVCLHLNQAGAEGLAKDFALMTWQDEYEKHHQPTP